MTLTLAAMLLALGLFLAMLLFLELGRQTGLHRLRQDPDGLASGTGTAEGSVFGLLGLLIAFTFSGAAERFEQRRHLITQEANAIGTAYLRLDLLGETDRVALQKQFSDYTLLRARAFRDVDDMPLTLQRLDETNRQQQLIWQQALQATQGSTAAPQAAMLLLPALNEMIDITTTRFVATQNHPPIAIFLLLTGLSLIGALLVGYEMAANHRRSWLHHLAFAAILSLSVYIIIDMEFPRFGMIRIHSADQVLLDLQQQMVAGQSGSPSQP